MATQFTGSIEPYRNGYRCKCVLSGNTATTSPETFPKLESTESNVGYITGPNEASVRANVKLIYGAKV